MGRVYEGVGEAWAAFNEGRNTRDRKTGKRVSFFRSELFSYTTCVARYQTAESGDKYVIATNRRYSMSTSSHISNCVGNCTVPVFYTYDIWAADNVILAALVGSFNNAVIDAVKGWKKVWWDWSYYLCHQYREIAEFCRLTGQEHGLLPINEITASVQMDREEKQAAFEDPKAVAKRERDYARRQAKLALKIAA